ncbi:MAG TPA: hypothetical protein VJN64_10175 [Terriglobales bacterium]|nr:hypothetical protein [Terriglobales bacterium]
MLSTEVIPQEIEQAVDAATFVPKAPWNTALHGMVTLYDVLKYAAAEVIALCQQLTAYAAIPQRALDQHYTSRLQSYLDTLHEHCEKLDLPLSTNQIRTVVNAVNGQNAERISDALYELHRRVVEELQVKVCFCLQGTKVKYWHPFWLVETPIYDNFRSAWEEFQRAGHCFAYGENTACVFHLMRIVDFGLRRVAASLGVEYDARNWIGIASKIQQRMEQKHQTKTDEWKKSEPLYAEILTDIQAISRGHRNPVLHELEKKYDDREAEHMLNVVEGFMLHLAKQGFRE